MKNIFFLLLLLMYGCTTQVQPELRRAVDEKIAIQRSVEIRCDASSDPFCAIQSPLIYLGSIDALKNQHHAALLDIGEDSLKARLHLIRAATKSIQFQNFLFRRDQTGGLVMNELVQAASRGVRVRIIFDQLFTVSELDYLAGLALEHRNFEVRLYNPLFNMAKTSRYTMFGGVTCCFKKTNQRMHSKLLVIDDVVGMTGGRNIADRYLDFDVNYDMDLAEEVLRITDSQGADLIFDPIGGPIVEQLAIAAASGATLIEYGALSTESTPFPLFQALGKGLIIRGYTLLEVTQVPDVFAAGKKFVLEGLANGGLKPVIDRTFSFEEFQAAHEYMASNQQMGKIVVTL